MKYRAPLDPCILYLFGMNIVFPHMFCWECR